MGVRRREIITSLKLAIKKGRITVHWKMPGTYLMTLDECPVRHLTTQRRRRCYKKLNLGVQFYFKTPQFSINKQSVPKGMYAHLQPPKKLHSPLERNRDIPSKTCSKTLQGQARGIWTYHSLKFEIWLYHEGPTLQSRITQKWLELSLSFFHIMKIWDICGHLQLV